MKAMLPEPLVFVSRKTEQLRRPGFPEGRQQAQARRLFAEIPLVQLGGRKRLKPKLS